MWGAVSKLVTLLWALWAMSRRRALEWNGRVDGGFASYWAKTSTAYATNGESQIRGFTTVIVSENPPVLATVATVWSDTTVSPQDLDAYLPDYLHFSLTRSMCGGQDLWAGLRRGWDGPRIERLTSAANLANISTRTMACTGDNVLIAGFIITGTQPKPLLGAASGLHLPIRLYNVPSVRLDPRPRAARFPWRDYPD